MPLAEYHFSMQRMQIAMHVYNCAIYQSVDQHAWQTWNDRELSNKNLEEEKRCMGSSSFCPRETLRRFQKALNRSNNRILPLALKV